jgi:hypothetical protein
MTYPFLYIWVVDAGLKIFFNDNLYLFSIKSDYQAFFDRSAGNPVILPRTPVTQSAMSVGLFLRTLLYPSADVFKLRLLQTEKHLNETLNRHRIDDHVQ